MAEKLIDSGPVLLDLEPDGMARLRLNRPEASNGMDVPLPQALYTAILRCHGEPRVRAVLLTGEGPNFCAGGDVHTFAAKGEALPDYLREATSWLQISTSALMHLQAPVVAAVQGFAAGGGGFGMVCAADMVIAAESAKFLSGATRVGMVSDAGVSVTLVQLVGLRKAMEIVLTNPILTAAQALAIGLITRVVPDGALLDEGLALARQLAAGALPHPQVPPLLPAVPSPRLPPTAPIRVARARCTTPFPRTPRGHSSASPGTRLRGA